MNQVFQDSILHSTGAQSMSESGVIQRLWSGYGKIVRYRLKGSDMKSVVVKHVRLPKPDQHPRGWNTDRSHQRKLRSYNIETHWYKTYSKDCNDYCRVPQCLALETVDDEVLMVLEDLDAAGYPRRKESVNRREVEACISWLAHFHATFMQKKPSGLWKTGTYWHLKTRPDELKALTDKSLRNAAPKIDQLLARSPFQTFVHGDAKLANFCFSQSGDRVAAIDFQYVGGGCGTKDLVYFIGSCYHENDCEAHEQSLLNYYFQQLEIALKLRKSKVDFAALESDWRDLYPVAWADFHRFIKGWSPGHWKINSYSERITKKVIKDLYRK
jgi:hypothetical protein